MGFLQLSMAILFVQCGANALFTKAHKHQDVGQTDHSGKGGNGSSNCRKNGRD